MDLVSACFTRLVNRTQAMTQVLRHVSRHTAAVIGQRLGWGNVFNPARPSLFYRLRMWRADDQEVCRKLARIADHRRERCFEHFTVNGEPRKISKGPGALHSVACTGTVSQKRSPVRCVQSGHVAQQSAPCAPLRLHAGGVSLVITDTHTALRRPSVLSCQRQTRCESLH